MLSEPAFEKRYEELGTYIRITTPEELTALIREQQQIWRPVIAEMIARCSGNETCGRPGRSDSWN